MNQKILLKRYGDTPLDAIENHLDIQDIEMPATSMLKPNEVLIAVKTTTVSFVDLIMMTGQYQHMAEPPYVPGLEFAGDVMAVGGDVRKFKVRERVFSDYQLVGPRSKGDYQSVGPHTLLFLRMPYTKFQGI